MGMLNPYAVCLELFTHLRGKMDTLNSGDLIRLFMGVKALVHIALRSPMFSRAGSPDSPSPSLTLHIIHIGSIHGQTLHAFEVA
jgi:hypothetical protein